MATGEVMATGEGIITGELMATGEAEIQGVQTTLIGVIVASRDRLSFVDHLARV